MKTTKFQRKKINSKDSLSEYTLIKKLGCC